MHGVGSLLQAQLRWTGPPAWQEYLNSQREHTAARWAIIARLLDAIDKGARDASLAPVALKGSALHQRKFYAAGERPMADVDLLVHADDADAVAQLLGNCNYISSCDIRRHRIFVPGDGKKLDRMIAGEHVDVPIKVEVHTRIYEHLPISQTDISHELHPHRAHAGLNSYPSDVALMIAIRN